MIALAEDEKHAAHLRGFSKASFLLYPLTPVQFSPANIPIPKLNLVAKVTQIEDSNGELRNRYDSVHPTSTKVFKDEETKIVFYEVKPTTMIFVGGKEPGATENIEVEKYIEAIPDIIAKDSPKILSVLNKAQGPLLALAKDFGGIPIRQDTAFAYWCDSLGFNIMGRSVQEDRWVDFRLPFENQITNTEDAIESINTTISNLK